ncbi:muconolactone Delta-isomerase family protein [Leptolyngbya sp. NIES-2104]|uniref:muconolactone Delta-isomerase family protein n=1 Tax=Leptolyngbya sp. NIES-2104 TaxID=1552121 RepID=UPI00092EE28F|nr:muconolactone Delta-isomerase family protein [Leptolyngbya sp. NIES-2104]
MQFLILFRVVTGTPMDQVFALVKEESARNWEFYAAGLFRQSFYFDDYSGAVILAEANTQDEVEMATQSFPMVKAGLLTVEVIPLRPYIGIAQLFANPVSLSA